jgi:hypothetical protein
VFRHTAFFIFKEDITPEKHLAMLKGLAYMRYECPTVVALDFGSDLFGGSSRLREVKPWDRTPRWHGAKEGPPTSYDVALMLDFEDAAGNEAYNDDDVHHEVAAYNAAVCQGELTARVDWEYEGEPLNRAGGVRHSAMFLWADGTEENARGEAQEAVRSLESQPGAESLTIGQNVGKLRTDFDWIVDVQLPDEDSAGALLESDAYRDAMAAVAPATKYEWTARLTHRMHDV